MTETMHPNLSLLNKLDLQNLDACQQIIADDFVWHYYNPQLPELQGDYRGTEGLIEFFTRLGKRSHGSFHRNVIDARPAGDELVVVQVCNRMELHGNRFEVDAIVVWRCVGGKIAEAWDIPAVNTVRPVQDKNLD